MKNDLLPPSPFTSSAIVERPAEAPAVTSEPQVPPCDVTADCALDLIDEIFVGARKLETAQHAGSPEIKTLAIEAWERTNPRMAQAIREMPGDMYFPPKEWLPELFPECRVESRFLLDEAAFIEALDPSPLFLQVARR